jgi:archaellum component FlaC
MEKKQSYRRIVYKEIATKAIFYTDWKEGETMSLCEKLLPECVQKFFNIDQKFLELNSTMEGRCQSIEHKLQSEYCETQSDIATLELHYIDLKKDMNNVKGEVDGLKNTVGIISTDVAVIKSEQKQTLRSLDELKEEQRYNRRWLLASLLTGVFTFLGVIINFIKP